MENAEIVVTAFGTVARIAKSAIDELKEEGVNIGMIRPITLWPFDVEGLRAAVKNAKAVVVLEGNAGMMCSDIRLFLEGTKPVYFHGRMGGSMVNTDSVKPKVKHILENKKDWSELNGKEGIWTAYDA